MPALLLTQYRLATDPIQVCNWSGTGLILISYSPATDPVLLLTRYRPAAHQYRPATDLIQACYWPGTGLLLTRYRPATDLIQTCYWPGTGQLLIRYNCCWTDTDLLLTQYRPSTGTATDPIQQVCYWYRDVTAFNNIKYIFLLHSLTSAKLESSWFSQVG